MKRIYKILGTLLLLLLLLVGTGYAILKSARVQTLLVNIATTYLSNKLHTTVSVGGVDVELMNKVVLQDVLIMDLHNDTIVHANALKITLGKLDTEKGNFKIIKTTLDNAVIKVAKYPNEKGLNFQFIIDAFDDGKPKDTTKNTPFKLLCHNFDLVNCNFEYNDYRKKRGKVGYLNWDYLKFTKINGNLSNIDVFNDSAQADLNHFACKEKSGFEVKSLDACATFAGNKMKYKHMKLITPNSSINGDVNFYMNSFDDFDDFFEKVQLVTHLQNSQLNMCDLVYFAEELTGMNKIVTIKNVETTGNIADFTAKNIDLKFGKSSQLIGKIHMTGLPDANNTLFDARIKKLVTNKEDIEGIPLPPFTEHKYIDLPPNAAALGNITYEGDYTGFYYNFVTYGKLTTALGTATTDIKINYDLDKETTTYKGNISTNNFDLGTLLHQKEVGLISMNGVIDGYEFNAATAKFTFDGTINRVDYNNYSYTNIATKGSFARNVFKGNVVSNDPNAKLNFEGSIDYTKRFPTLDFTANIARLDLYTTHLTTDIAPTIFSGNSKVHFSGNSIDDAQGNAQINDIVLNFNNKQYALNNLTVQAQNYGKRERSINVQSSFFDADINGAFTLSTLPESFKNLANYYLSNFEQVKTLKAKPTNDAFDYNLVFKNVQPICDWLLPELKIAPNSKLHGNYNAQQKDINVQASSNSITYAGYVFNNLKTSVTRNNQSIESYTTLDAIQLTDSISLKNVVLSANATNNLINYNFAYNNNYKIKNSGSISGNAVFATNNVINCKLNASQIILADSVWNIAPNSLISIDSSGISIDKFMVQLNNSTQQIMAEGSISKNPRKELFVQIKDFNTANFNEYLKSNDVAMKGVLNSTITLSNLYNKTKILANVNLDSLHINNELLGKFKLNSTYDYAKQAVVIDGTGIRNDLNSITINGYYYTNKADAFDINFGLTQTPLSIINMFTSGILSNIKGNVAGNVKLLGSAKKPYLKGVLNATDAGFKVDYLNTYYTFSHKIIINENSIRATDALLSDEFGNTAKTQFGLTHNYFTNFKFDVLMETERFHCLNLTASQNDMFYGQAYAKGYMRLTGPVENIKFDISARTLTGSHLYIPMSTPDDVGESEFIHFVTKNKAQPIVAQKKFNGLSMNFDLEITRDALAEIVFDDKVGDVIKGHGNGNIRMEINSFGQFDMYGEYKINDGDYLFTLKNILNKHFIIEPGGTVTWTGDPYDADMNMTATYKVNASLAPILSTDNNTTTTAYNKPIPVSCKLLLTNKLMNPNVNFAIDLSNSRIDQSVKDEFNSTVRPDDIQEINRQVFSLLLQSSFLTPSGRVSALTGTGGNAGSGAATSSVELLTSQLNNWLSGSVKGLDLNVKYLPPTQNSGQQAGVNFSTQLLNERLDVQGNFGVNSSANSTTAKGTNYYVSDLKLEYKLTSDGRIRLKAYNITNDVSTLTANGLYTQGVGLAYRREFDRLRDAFHKNKTVN